MRIIKAGVLSALFCAWVAVAGAANVEVMGTKFAASRLPGQSYAWFEAQVDLRAVGSVPAQNVNVKLMVRFKKGGEVYVGKAELYAIETGSNPKVRFYLPPDAVRAAQLPSVPETYLIEISSQGGVEVFDRRMASPSLTTLKAREELATQASVGIPLLPIYKTPFYSIAENWKDMAAYQIP